MAGSKGVNRLAVVPSGFLFLVSADQQNST